MIYNLTAIVENKSDNKKGAEIKNRKRFIDTYETHFAHFDACVQNPQCILESCKFVRKHLFVILSGMPLEKRVFNKNIQFCSECAIFGMVIFMIYTKNGILNKNTVGLFFSCLFTLLYLCQDLLELFSCIQIQL